MVRVARDGLVLWIGDGSGQGVPMHFGHSTELWSDFPGLAAGVIAASGITPDADVSAELSRFEEIARQRLASVSSESEFPEIQAWRRAFSQLGLKPTQYRCASESLLRRFRKEGSLPRIHPLVDMCNAISLAFAIPVAVIDVGKVSRDLQVRYATGEEVYLAFSGQLESPEKGEVTYADSTGRAHARRWTNRQSAYSAVSGETAEVLIVAEALHAGGDTDVRKLTDTIADELAACWQTDPQSSLLTRESPTFATSSEV